MTTECERRAELIAALGGDAGRYLLVVVAAERWALRPARNALHEPR